MLTKTIIITTARGHVATRVASGFRGALLGYGQPWLGDGENGGGGEGWKGMGRDERMRRKKNCVSFLYTIIQ